MKCMQLVLCKHFCQEFWNLHIEEAAIRSPPLFLKRYFPFLFPSAMEMQWSPQHAMNAYLNTLQLASAIGGGGSSRCEEPKCMEFLSALAAGNGAKLIVQITSAKGITPLTLALAVATKQTVGARFICIIPQQNCHHHSAELTSINIELINHDLKDVIEFVVGNPYEIIREFKKIDFLVIVSEFGDPSKLWKNIDLNPKGSLLVFTNLQRGRRHNNYVLRGINVKGNQETITLPIGDGIELMKIRPLRPRRYRRFHVTYEN